MQAQAEARAEALRQLASLQLRALGQAALTRDKPKLVLALCAHAPKVAVSVCACVCVCGCVCVCVCECVCRSEERSVGKECVP